MKKVTISHHLIHYLDYILIDGKNVEFTKDKETKKYVLEYETDKDFVTIELDSFHPLLVKGWWIKAMITFFLSVFGIFETREKHDYVYLYKSVVKLDKVHTYINLTGSLQGKILTTESDGPVTEISNERYKDPRIKKRKTGLIWSKIAAIVLILGIVVGIIIAVTK